MLALHHPFLPAIKATYIICVPRHQGSAEMAERAMASCRAIGQSADFFFGFDGTRGPVRTPSLLANESWPSWIKLYDERLTAAQIGCAMSHIALWAQCMTLDHPIVVLEHDAVMLKPYRLHRYPNTIAHLGWPDGEGPISKLNSGANWTFIAGTHAYALDPLAAHRLFAIVLERGLYAPIDIMMRIADVAIIPEEGHADLRRGATTVVNE